MTLDQFLERFVEGYRWRLANDGGDQNPSGQAVRSGWLSDGVEHTCRGQLLGVLTADKIFNPTEGVLRFEDFWTGFLSRST